MFGFGIPELVVLIVIAVIFVPGIFYLLALKKALLACSVDSRTMSPGMVWLLLIPLVNVVWNFVVVISISKSLQNEFAKRNMIEGPNPGQGVGLGMCILSIVSYVPYLGAFAAIGAFACWIIYWVKINGYTTKLKNENNELMVQPAGNL